MLFPDYGQSSPVVSTAYRIKEYAKRAEKRILQHAEEIYTATRSIDGEATTVLDRAYTKLKNVKRKRLSTSWGQASATAIDISDAPMQESYVLGTLIHEALHDCFFHGDGRCYTEEEEHKVMYVLGEI